MMKSSSVLYVSDIPVYVSKNKGQKNLYIKVCPPDGQVKVSSPASTSDKKIISFVQLKMSTIKRHQQRLISQFRQSKREYVSGEAFYFWGKPLMLQVVLCDKAKSKAQKMADKLVLTVPRGSSTEFREKKVNELYRSELKRVIQNLSSSVEGKVGVKPHEYRIKNMKTRWGTCNVNAKRIWINLQLAKKPPECLEYVLIHELCHLLEKNHTKRFWALVEQFCPNWKEAKRTLDSMPLDYYETQ